MSLPDVCQLSICHIALPEHAESPAGCDSWRVQQTASAAPAAFLCWLLLIHHARNALQAARSAKKVAKIHVATRTACCDIQVSREALGSTGDNATLRIRASNRHSSGMKAVDLTVCKFHHSKE